MTSMSKSEWQALHTWIRRKCSEPGMTYKKLLRLAGLPPSDVLLYHHYMTSSARDRSPPSVKPGTYGQVFVDALRQLRQMDKNDLVAHMELSQTDAEERHAQLKQDIHQLNPHAYAFFNPTANTVFISFRDGHSPLDTTKKEQIDEVCHKLYPDAEVQLIQLCEETGHVEGGAILAREDNKTGTIGAFLLTVTDTIAGKVMI